MTSFFPPHTSLGVVKTSCFGNKIWGTLGYALIKLHMHKTVVSRLYNVPADSLGHSWIVYENMAKDLVVSQTLCPHGPSSVTETVCQITSCIVVLSSHGHT